MPQKVSHYLGHFFFWKEKVKYDYTFKLECVKSELPDKYEVIKEIINLFITNSKVVMYIY
jgi:hypothetical protein